MNRLIRIAILLIIIISTTNACQNLNMHQNQEKISEQTYEKIVKFCPGGYRKVMLVYYFDGDCAMCLGKASYIEKYANARGLKPVLIAKTMNPAEFRYNLQKLNIRTCVYMEENLEFENKINFMKVTKIDVDRNVQNYDKEVDNNQ